MAAEVVCGRGVGVDHDGDNVSVVADQVEDWGVVFEYGDVGVDWVVFCDGDCAVDLVCGDGVYGAAGLVAVSEFV